MKARELVREDETIEPQIWIKNHSVKKNRNHDISNINLLLKAQI